MLSSDMPELQSTLDIAFIKNKLAVDEPEEIARKHFEGFSYFYVYV